MVGSPISYAVGQREPTQSIESTDSAEAAETSVGEEPKETGQTAQTNNKMVSEQL